MENQLQQLCKWLKESSHTVILTGAGMSTESGLPDFRSNQGLWHGRDPQEIASIDAIYQRRQDFVDFYRWRIKEIENHQPNEGHEIITTLQRQGYIQHILTQNVDGFHQQAKSFHVVELHGTLREVYCMDCGLSLSSERYLEDRGEICSQCQGFLRPKIVLFGEMLPEEAINKAFKEVQDAELIIVLGSSLQVSPVNMLPLEAKHNEARFVIINLEETYLDNQADMVIHGKIGDTLRQVQKLL